MFTFTGADTLLGMKSPAESFTRAYEIIKRLRSPTGCPWDREQTPASMRASLIEEAYECVEAINDNDPAHVREELGDVFLLAIFIGYMYEEAGHFSVGDSLEELSEKLVRRHPHVFGDAAAADSAEVLRQWDVIKEPLQLGPNVAIVPEGPGLGVELDEKRLK